MSAAEETLGKTKYSDRNFRYLVAISYAREVEETAARLDRGLVELLGGDAERVFFDVRSRANRLSPEQVEPVLQDVFENILLFVRIWSPEYDHSSFTEIEKAAASPILLNERDRAYAIRAADGNPSPPITFNAELVGKSRLPLWRVAEDIVARLDQLMGGEFQRTRRRDRAFVKWDPPAYQAIAADSPKEVCAFDCRQALAACCEAGELYCLVAQLAARLTPFSFLAQTVASANRTGALVDYGYLVEANQNLSVACGEFLDVFAARYDHLRSMVMERGRAAKGSESDGAQPRTDHPSDATVDGMFCSRKTKDERPQQAERLGDFLYQHIGTDHGTSEKFAASVLRLAVNEPLAPSDRHDVANQLVLWSKQIAWRIAALSARREYLPRMAQYRCDPRSAAAKYALQTNAALVPLV